MTVQTIVQTIEKIERNRAAFKDEERSIRAAGYAPEMMGKRLTVAYHAAMKRHQVLMTAYDKDVEGTRMVLAGTAFRAPASGGGGDGSAYRDALKQVQTTGADKGRLLEQARLTGDTVLIRALGATAYAGEDWALFEALEGLDRHIDDLGDFLASGFVRCELAKPDAVVSLSSRIAPPTRPAEAVSGMSDSELSEWAKQGAPERHPNEFAYRR